MILGGRDRHLNPNQTERDRLIFGENSPRYGGGMARFEDLDVATLKKLIELRYADPEDKQNEAPTIAEFVALLERHDTEDSDLTAHGYVIHKERDDYRVSIEGIEGTTRFSEGLLDILTVCVTADEFTVESDLTFHVRAWWD